MVFLILKSLLFVLSCNVFGEGASFEAQVQLWRGSILCAHMPVPGFRKVGAAGPTERWACQFWCWYLIVLYLIKSIIFLERNLCTIIIHIVYRISWKNAVPKYKSPNSHGVLVFIDYWLMINLVHQYLSEEKSGSNSLLLFYLCKSREFQKFMCAYGSTFP